MREYRFITMNCNVESPQDYITCAIIGTAIADGPHNVGNCGC